MRDEDDAITTNTGFFQPLDAHVPEARFGLELDDDSLEIPLCYDSFRFLFFAYILHFTASKG